ncbi:MAG: NHLP leader peptide family natural product precursor [Desulfarculus sp.]|nr:NHLP leader peptide family natural product precursor [Desulfarculus sp.]
MPQNRQDQGRLWAKVVARAWADEIYKKKLISDPAVVLKAEGIEVPQAAQLKVVEDTTTLRHLVLPAMPAEAASLDEDALSDRMAADFFTAGFSTGGY